jgi:hypothetical protein
MVVAPDSPQPQVIGLVIRGLRAELERRGLLDQVRERIGAEARALLDDPPLHITWVPARHHDEIVAAIAALTNRSMVREFGYGIARGTTGPLTLPLLRALLSLFGATPATLLRNMDKISVLQVKGTEFKYEPESERAGTVQVRFTDRVDPVQFAIWEGVFRFAEDVVSTPMTIDPAIPQMDGRTGHIHVRW